MPTGLPAFGRQKGKKELKMSLLFFDPFGCSHSCLAGQAGSLARESSR